MGACACVDNSSSIQSSITALIDSPTNEKIININNTSPNVNEYSLSLEQYPKKPLPSNYKTISSTLERTQCSSTTQDVFSSEPLIINGDIKLITNDVLQKVIYKPNRDANNVNKINIAICGGKQTGKSAFAIKYVENYFEKLYIPSISVEEHNKSLKYGKLMLTFNFSITPGEVGYDVDYDSVMRDADFIFVFYDTSVNGSFDSAKKFAEKDLEKYKKEYSGVNKNILFIGNKIDVVPRKEPKEKIEKYCTEHMFKFFEISVKNTTGIKNVIHYIVMTHLQLIENKSM